MLMRVLIKKRNSYSDVGKLGDDADFHNQQNALIIVA